MYCVLLETFFMAKALKELLLSLMNMIYPEGATETKIVNICNWNSKWTSLNVKTLFYDLLVQNTENESKKHCDHLK